MRNISILTCTLLVLLVGFAGAFAAQPSITDRTGKVWPLDQAVKLGFTPQNFNFGLGPHAFTPLDENDIVRNPEGISPKERVLGYTHQGEALAASISSLSSHETANVTVGNKAVTMSY